MDGTPKVASDLRPNDRVTIGGIEMTVANAERQGLLTRDARTGIPENVTPEAMKEATGEADVERAALAAQNAEADRAARAQANVLSDPNAEAAAQDIAAKVGEGDQIAAIMQLMDRGEVSASTLSRAASQAMVTPDEMGGKLATVMDGFTKQAQAYAEARGVPFELFQGWARVHHLSDVKMAAVQHITGRDVSAWGPLMDNFMVRLDTIAPDVVTQATFPNGGHAIYDPGRRCVVIHMPDGTSMTWGGAYRAGLLGDMKWGR